MTAVQTARPITDTLTNEISGASVASNQITLPAGTYYCNGWQTFNGSGVFHTNIWNVTDSSWVMYGSSGGTAGASSAWHSNIRGRFTLAGTKVLEYRYRCSGGNAGVASGLGDEVYMELCIWKIA